MWYICNHQVAPLTICIKQMRAIRPISFTIKNSNCAKNNSDYRSKHTLVLDTALCCCSVICNLLANLLMEQFMRLSTTLCYVTCTLSFTFLLLWHAFCHVTNKRIWWWVDHRHEYSRRLWGREGFWLTAGAAPIGVAEAAPANETWVVLSQLFGEYGSVTMPPVESQALLGGVAQW